MAAVARERAAPVPKAGAALVLAACGGGSSATGLTGQVRGSVVGVAFTAGGVVTLTVDNGKDGTVDRTITTSVTELDSLLGNP